MIYFFHGAFDHKDDLGSGVEILAATTRIILAEFGEAATVETFESEEWPTIDWDRFLTEPLCIFGYSNGVHLAVDLISRLFSETATQNERPLETHLRFVDGVRRGGGMFGAPFHIPKEVNSCKHYIRDTDVGGFPYHQMIDRIDPPLFETFRLVGTEHKTIIYNSLVQRDVPKDIVQVFLNWRKNENANTPSN